MTDEIEMIDINKLRRLAQAATPGGWYVERGNYVYGCKGSSRRRHHAK